MLARQAAPGPLGCAPSSGIGARPGLKHQQGVAEIDRGAEGPRAEGPAFRPRDPERTRAAILKAARDEFCELGLPGARVDAIAVRAGANKRLLYHYFGNKEALYLAVLSDAYHEIRAGERQLELERLAPEAAMEQLVRFTLRHFLANPWFPRLLSNENLQNARFLRQLPEIPALHAPLIGQIDAILRRGAQSGAFRDNIDPVATYIAIAGLCSFYVSNMKTLSTIFERDLAAPDLVGQHEAQSVEMVLRYLRPPRPSAHSRFHTGSDTLK